LAFATHKKMMEVVEGDPTGYAVTNSKGQFVNAQRVISNAKAIINATANLEKDNAKITDQLYDPITGRTRPGYEGVKVISYQNGKPVYDVSSLSVDQKTKLSMNLSPGMQNQVRLAGSSYAVNGLDNALIANAFNPNSISSIKMDGVDITADYTKGDAPGFLAEVLRLPASELKGVFGAGATADFDPVSRSMHVTFKVGGDNPTMGKFKSLKGKQGVVTMEIPYDKVKSNPKLMERFGEIIMDNEADNSTLGITQTLMADPYATIKAPSYMKMHKFDYTAMIAPSAQDGQELLINYEIFEPKLGRIVQAQSHVPIPTVNKKNLLAAEDKIFEKYEQYRNYMVGHEALQFSGENNVPLSPDND
jgi:hypothetical protein